MLNIICAKIHYFRENITFFPLLVIVLLLPLFSELAGNKEEAEFVVKCGIFFTRENL